MRSILMIIVWYLIINFVVCFLCGFVIIGKYADQPNPLPPDVLDKVLPYTIYFSIAAAVIGTLAGKLPWTEGLWDDDYDDEEEE